MLQDIYLIQHRSQLWICLLHRYNKCFMSEEAWKNAPIPPRNVFRSPQLMRLWSVTIHVALAQIHPHLVHASVLFLECVTRVDRCLLPSTVMGGRIPADRSGWVRSLSGGPRDNLHSSSRNVTEPEDICPQDSRGEVPVCPSRLVVVLWPAVGSDEVLSAVTVHQHRSESLRRAWNWPAASGTHLHD